MPHRSFGAVRAGVERHPITFDFGLYGEETFTVVPDPSLGDTFDLADAPEPDPDNLLEVARVLARFISRMLAPEDRKRFADALYKIPATEVGLIVECAQYIAEHVTTFPTVPPGSSSPGRRSSGTSSKPRRAGGARSSTSSPGGRSR